MASRGSVIPLFIQQVKDGQPLTVTDPNMTRFMMSIDDAVDLVLFRVRARQARRHLRPEGAGGNHRDAGARRQAAVRRARIPIRVIGTRHGEKLFETLLTREERVKAQDMGSYFRVPADNRDLNYNAYFAEGQEILSHEEDYHSHNTRRLDVDGMMEMLLKLDFVRRELDAWQRHERAGARAHENHDDSRNETGNHPLSAASSRLSIGDRRTHSRPHRPELRSTAERAVLQASSGPDAGRSLGVQAPSSRSRRVRFSSGSAPCWQSTARIAC